jgi:exopolysaccharide biosynthesis polyprenyl glycosylphosphotransferase
LAKVAHFVQPVGTGHRRASSVPAPMERPLRGLRGPHNDAFRRRLLFVADQLCVLTAIGVMTLVEGTTDPLWALITLPFWTVLAKVEGLYDADHPKIWHRTTDEAAAIFHWVTLSAAGTLFFIRALEYETVTVEAAGAMYFTALGGAFVLRAAARALWRGLVPPERALVLGSGQLAEQVRRKLALEPGHHLVLGDFSTLWRSNGESDQEPLLEALSKQDLEYLVAGVEVDRLILAVPELDEATLARVVAACRAAGVKLSVLPPMRAMLGTAVQLSHIAEMPVIEYGTWNTTWSTQALKRAMDIVVSAVGLAFTAPLMVVIAVLVRLDSRGPALFKQFRAGRHGEPFRFIKFRTMSRDAEERISEVVSLDELKEPMYKLRSDPRVTRVGRFLRRTSLDELPQLVNVLRGDMSLVGPRPEELWLVERYGDTERFRLEMRPGMTGPMQVHGRGQLTFQERLAVEREYVENYSLKKDLQILLRTAGAIFRADGAY